MKHKLIFALLLPLLLVSTATAEGITFQGNTYSSIDALRAVALAENPDLIIGCGPATSHADALRGYYDENTLWVCHIGDDANNAQFLSNQAMRQAYPSTAIIAQPSSTHSATQRYQCSDHNRGTPYQNYFYNTAMDDVCRSNPRENVSHEVRIRSYWQNGYGRTYFFYLHYPNQYYWLDGSIAITPPEVRGHAMRFYQWCFYVGGRCV